MKVVHNLHRWRNAFFVAGLLGSIPAMVTAQSVLRFEHEGAERTVDGVRDGSLVWSENGRVFPVPVGAEIRVEPAEDPVPIRGRFEFWYDVMAVPDTREGAPAKLNVRLTVHLETAGNLEQLVLVRGWIHDGVLTRVSNEPVMPLHGSHWWKRWLTFEIDASMADGVAWCGLYERGRPVLMLRDRAKDGPQVELDAAVEAGDDARVADALAAGAKWRDLSDPVIGAMANHGRTDWIKAWAADRRGWQKKQGPDLLWRATSAGRLNAVRWLLAQDVPAEKAQQEQRGLLVAAVETNRIEVLETILAGRDGSWKVDARDEQPLLVAAFAGRADMVGRLRQAGLNWPSRAEGYLRVLMRATSRRSVEAVRLVLQSGIFSTRSAGYDRVQGETLMHAAALGEVEIVRLLLQPEVSWAGLDKLDLNPLAPAVRNNRIEVVDLLVEAGANPHALFDNNDWDLVSIALVRGHLDMARNLIEKGVEATKLDDRLQQIWWRAMLDRNEAVGTWLLEQGQGLGRDAENAAKLVRTAIAEDFAPVLQAAAANGWTGTRDLGDGWSVAGLAAWHGVTLPPGLAGDPASGEGPTNFVSAKGLEVRQRLAPAFPASLYGQLDEGEVMLQLLIRPDGSVGYGRVLEATAPEFGRAAWRKAMDWRFSPVDDSTGGWRRVKVPVGFSAPDILEGLVDARELDRMPVVIRRQAIEPPPSVDPQQEGIAWVTVVVSDAGEVQRARVELITDEAWRRTVEAAVSRWTYQPATKGDATVATAVREFVRFPGAEILPADGLPVDYGQSATGNRAVLRSFDFLRIPRKEMPNGGLLLAKVKVAKNGRPEDVKVLAASHPKLIEVGERGISRWRFSYAQRDGQPVEQDLLLPIVVWATD